MGCKHLREYIKLKKLKSLKVDFHCSKCDQLATRICTDCGIFACDSCTLHTIYYNLSSRELYCIQCKVIPKENSLVKEAKGIILQKLQAVTEAEVVTNEVAIQYMSKQLSLSPGLSNLGNTCFFNSVIQAIAYTKALHEFTAEEQHTLTITLFRLMKKLNTDRKETVNPKELFDILKTSWGVYGRYGQQDSHEMLRRLLDGIRNEQLGLDLNGSKKEPNVLDGNDNAFPPSSQDLPSNIEAEQKSEIPENSKESCGDELTSHSIEERKSTVVDQVFGGNLVSTIICATCKNISYSFENFLDLSLSMPGNVEEGKFKNYMNSLGRQVKKNLFNQKKEVESVSVTQQMTTLSISTNAALPREKVELIRKILKTDPILINSNPTISQCVAKFFDIEVLENDNGFVCENCAKDKREETMSDITISRTPSDMSMDSCGAVVEAESQVQEKDSVSVETVYTRAFKRYMLYTPPRVLVLHMKRFSQKGNKVSKVNNHVTFEEEIDISEFVAPPLPSDQKNGRQLQSCNYRLYAVIVHSGTMNGGHYVAYIRKQSASGEKVSWQYCSDSLVRFTNWDEVARCKPYMLFYENYNKV